MNLPSGQRIFHRYLAELAMVWTAILVYNTIPYYHTFLNTRLQYSLLLLAAAYSVYAVHVTRIRLQKGQDTKGWMMGRYIGHLYRVLIKRKKEKANPEDRVAFLAFWVKFYFIPVMMNFSYRNLANLKYYSLQLLADSNQFSATISYFNTQLFPLLVSVCYVTLTGIYLFGYIVESPALNNKVKSVDPSLFGWAVTLACYPPFSNFISRHIRFEININASFGNEVTTFIVRILMLALMGLMFWSVGVLGTKCSNLTNRGIITNGPYRWLRHPHYTAKNLMWWCTILPAVPERPIVILFLAMWTAIYILRGLTEEKHLMSDPEYQAYCEKVKWKFFPGIW
ncbi:MAG: DUF1295 domain-containing protein [Flavobacteriales bacterium]|nr:DUF1295 domain-containing protein [Flavobacteriales bacterium]